MSSKKNYSKVKFVKVKVIEQDLRSEQEIEMKKERIAIRVTTLPNGYSVDLEKENFMYYSPMALLEGLFVHVGMNREGALTKRGDQDTDRGRERRWCRDEATGGGEPVERHHR